MAYPRALFHRTLRKVLSSFYGRGLRRAGAKGFLGNCVFVLCATSCTGLYLVQKVRLFKVLTGCIARACE